MQTNWLLIGCEMIGEKTGNEGVGGTLVGQQASQLNEWTFSDRTH